MESIGKQRSLTVMLLALLLTLAASNTLLIYQNLQMRATLSKIRPREQESLRVGDEVRSFSALGIDGNVVNVNYTGAGSKRLGSVANLDLQAIIVVSRFSTKLIGSFNET